MVFLQGVGVSTAYAAKIYRQYGKESIATVKQNPYRLADDIWGIGFKTADGIARKMGYEKNDPRGHPQGAGFQSDGADGRTGHCQGAGLCGEKQSRV
jgi:exodeoxyribonuclease V alpha subunit